MTAPSTSVLVPPERVERWIENFAGRHGEVSCGIHDGALIATAADSSTFRALLPFEAHYDAAPAPQPFAEAVRDAVPAEWGVLLVRKGGFAVACLHRLEIVASKVGQRHVQGRTKAGGQSQQRFARRRDNQAREAYRAAADHAARILGALDGPLVVGGDRAAAEAVLTDSRLSGLVVAGPWLPVPDPRRAVLHDAVADASSAVIAVVNAGS